MSLPAFTKHQRWSHEVDRLKDLICSKLKRHLYAERQAMLNVLRHFESQFVGSLVEAVREARLEVHRISSTFHESRLHKRLLWLVRQHQDQTTNTAERLHDPSSAQQGPGPAPHQPALPILQAGATQTFVPAVVSVELPPTRRHASGPVSTTAVERITTLPTPSSLSPSDLSLSTPASSHLLSTSVLPSHSHLNSSFHHNFQNSPNLNSSVSYDMLVTDLTLTLSESEKKLLSKGPKFAISEAVNDRTRHNVTISFCRLANELRWKEHFRRQNVVVNEQFPKYPFKDEILQPPKYPDFERKLARINEKINQAMSTTNNKKEGGNLTSEERATLADLKARNLRILPSDKGGEFCVIENDKYIELGNNHLHDDNIYADVTSITPKTIEMRVNNIWRKVASRKNINISTVKRYTSNNTDLANFYFLIKTHKRGTEIKIRPIISNTNCPTTKLSWLLDKALKPLLEFAPYHLENTTQLINRINELSSDDRIAYMYPFSLDVVSLYTSIPQTAAVDNIKNMMVENNYSFYGLNEADVEELLNVVISNNYFVFNKKVYKQVHGLAMGSSVSAILAILFMNRIETRALRLLDGQIGFYSRYVDDVFLLTKDRNTAEVIHNTFNNIDESIKFEIEHPDENNTLKLLDVAITLTGGNVHFNFYKKEIKKPIFVNYHSALPTRSKMHIVRNERQRIMNNCSNNAEKIEHLTSFNSVLRMNEYPDNFIHHPVTIPMNTDTSERDARDSNYAYLDFPYINDSINRKITQCFRKEGLKVRLSQKTKSLRNTLKLKQNNNRACTKRGCLLDPIMCFQKNVIYSIRCDKCGMNYVGSTIRHLHDRVHEHFNNHNSSVRKHMNECNVSPDIMNVKIIDRERRKGNLRIREAFYIQKFRPDINNKEESCLDLILF